MSDSRICIKCDTAMTPLTIVGIEIDRCPDCSGIWLDANEVKSLAAQPGEALNEIRAVDNESASVAPTTTGDDGAVLDKPCPACGGKLAHATFSDTTVEHCGGCFGLFLDRGELQKAMTLVDTTEATTIVALAKSVQTSGEL